MLGAFKKSKRPYWGVMGRQFNIYRVLLDFSDSPTDACIYHIFWVDVVFRQILTFLEDSVAIVYGLRGL